MRRASQQKRHEAGDGGDEPAAPLKPMASSRIPSRSPAPRLVLEGVTKVYAMGSVRVEALRGVDLEVPSGTFLAVMGPSGCGKSTLLHLMGAVDLPTSGRVVVDGIATGRLSERQRTLLRREKVGFVFQFFHLLPTFTVLENVSLPLLLAGQPPREARARVAELLQAVGLGHRQGHWPHQLSGGEQQRVAIARALVHRPPLLLADEPTGNLDSENGAAVLRLLRELPRRFGTTVVMATHSREAAAAADRVVHMRDGRIVQAEAMP